MNEQLATMVPFEQDGIEISVGAEGVRFVGVISMRNPSESVTPYLRRIHAAALQAGVKKLTVNLAQLRFMNSSSIRSLVDWVESIRREPEAKRYVLHFIAKRDVTWQHTTLSAVQCFGGEQVVVHRGE